MASLPRPEIHAIFLSQADKGDPLEQRKIIGVKAIRPDGSQWCWRGVGLTDKAAVEDLVRAMLDDPHTAEFVREG